MILNPHGTSLISSSLDRSDGRGHSVLWTDLYGTTGTESTPTPDGLWTIDSLTSILILERSLVALSGPSEKENQFVPTLSD
ncbi:hypothetical protein J6590_071400 [Homalodisca vitripennis]|nr:hypothetical protein J6590_071400 [Homalodisca vitripennis]